jgi:hypothetical protein
VQVAFDGTAVFSLPADLIEQSNVHLLHEVQGAMVDSAMPLEDSAMPLEDDFALMPPPPIMTRMPLMPQDQDAVDATTADQDQDAVDATAADQDQDATTGHIFFKVIYTSVSRKIVLGKVPLDSDIIVQLFPEIHATHAERGSTAIATSSRAVSAVRWCLASTVFLVRVVLYCVVFFSAIVTCKIFTTTRRNVDLPNDNYNHNHNDNHNDDHCQVQQWPL